MTQYPSLPDCGGVWTRSGCSAACELRITDEPHRAQGSSICKQAIYSLLSVLQQWQQALCQSTLAPSQSHTECPDGNTFCPLLCYQSSDSSPLPPFPLGEITQGVVNSSNITYDMTTLHQRTRIWPFIFPNTGE